MSGASGLVRPALAGALVGLLLAILYAGLAPTWVQQPRSEQFASNGERIYLTATSERGTPITMSMGRMQMGGMMGMGGMGGMMACVDCHGLDGRGGAVNMMMGSFEAPDIRYQTLAQPGRGQPSDHAAHPPYDDATLGLAITQGVNPLGDALEFPMPRWQLSDEDLADLVAYLKTLP